jgi:hypothetical protein
MQKIVQNTVQLVKIALGLWIAALLIVAASGPKDTPGQSVAAPAGTVNVPSVGMDPGEAKEKLVMILVIIGLLTMVYFGRKLRTKHRKKLDALQSAKS